MSQKRNGRTVVAVEVGAWNLKITSPDDLVVAAALYVRLLPGLGAQRAPVLVYMLVIAAMAWLAIERWRSHGDVAALLSERVGVTAKFRQGDALDLPFEDASFDVVWTEHAQMNIADKETFYRQIRRVLKPGGRLIVAVPNFSSAQAHWSGPHWFHLDPPRRDVNLDMDAFGRIFPIPVDNGVL